jgi:hypothetical protein
MLLGGSDIGVPHLPWLLGVEAMVSVRQTKQAWMFRDQVRVDRLGQGHSHRPSRPYARI